MMISLWKCCFGVSCRKGEKNSNKIFISLTFSCFCYFGFIEGGHVIVDRYYKVSSICQVDEMEYLPKV